MSSPSDTFEPAPGTRAQGNSEPDPLERTVNARGIDGARAIDQALALRRHDHQRIVLVSAILFALLLACLYAILVRDTDWARFLSGRSAVVTSSATTGDRAGAWRSVGGVAHAPPRFLFRHRQHYAGGDHLPLWAAPRVTLLPGQRFEGGRGEQGDCAWSAAKDQGQHAAWCTAQRTLLHTRPSARPSS